MKTFKLKALSAVFAAGAMLAAGAASAQTVVSGGATLPQPFYNSIFAGSSATWSYTGTGSGAGKTNFLANNPQAGSKSFINAATGLAWPTSQAVHLAGSDSRLSQDEVDDYNSTLAATLGPILQIPVRVTPVTLPYSKSGTTAVNLTRDQVCKIFSYDPAARTWGQILGSSDTSPIRVVYREEGSGTAELLAQFLTSSACAGYGFTFSNVFPDIVATSNGVQANGGIPGDWINADVGSLGIEAVLLAENNTFSYLSPAFSFRENDPTKVATIDNVLPAAISWSAALPPAANRGNPVAWVPPFPLPSGTGYPIGGTTNLLVPQCFTDGTTGAGEVGTAVVDFVDHAINDPAFQGLFKLPSNWLGLVNATFLNPSNPQGIGNTSVCGSLGRAS